METAWPQLAVLGEVAVAMVLGGLIGFERELAQRPAGLRTHMLLAGACALIVGIGDAMLSVFGASHSEFIRADPFRLVGGVIAALGFIAAGTIFQNRANNVQGLTTATGLMFSGAVGVCTALTQWWLAVGATALALLVLRGAWEMERRIAAKAAESPQAKRIDSD